MRRGRDGQSTRRPYGGASNPALYLREDGRLMVFFSPHSGRHLPVGRVSRRTYSIYHGGHWSAAHEIVKGPNSQRPCAKYAAGATGSGVVHIAFTETHPSQSHTHVHYLQYRLGRGFYHADGRRISGLRGLPIVGNRSDLVHDYDREGRAWVMDVTDDGAGNAVIVNSAGFGRSMQYFRYSRWTGDRWFNHRITRAYTHPRHDRSAGMFQTGGIVLDHPDPSIVYLSRIVRKKAAVEMWRTPDSGKMWARVRRLSPWGQNYIDRPRR